MPELKEPTVCEVECEHEDCEHWKQFVGTECNRCNKPIKSGDAYYEDIAGKPEHAECVWAQVKRRNPE